MAAKAQAPEPEPDPEPELEPEPEPNGDAEEAAWAKATPRLKAIFRESFDEYLAEIAEGEEVPEPEPKPKPAGAGRAATVGPGAGLGARPAGDGFAGAASTRRTGKAPRPSGGTILDLILGR